MSTRTGSATEAEAYRNASVKRLTEGSLSRRMRNRVDRHDGSENGQAATRGGRADSDPESGIQASRH